MPEGSTVTNFQVPSLSDGGRLAFVASYLDGGVLRTGLWVETDRLRKVCATGDLLTCGDGTTREVSFLAFRAGGHSASSALQATSASGWDDDGTELLFRASYTDGAQAIWRGSSFRASHGRNRGLALHRVTSRHPERGRNLFPTQSSAPSHSLQQFRSRPLWLSLLPQDADHPSTCATR
jgi:hypothetical protein